MPGVRKPLRTDRWMGTILRFRGYIGARAKSDPELNPSGSCAGWPPSRRPSFIVDGRYPKDAASLLRQKLSVKKKRMVDLKPSTAVDALGRFRKLSPVHRRELVGLWRGSGVPTGHPLDGVLENLGWFGKRFHPNLRADALLFQFGPGRLVALDPAYIPLELALRLGSMGRTRLARYSFRFLKRPLRARGPTATLEMQDFEGIRSAAMVYDRQPITDRFRRIGDDQLLGMMSALHDPRPYFFTLTRQE